MLLNRTYINLKKVIAPYTQLNETWGWFIDIDRDTDIVKTLQHHKQSYIYDCNYKIRHISSYKSVQNLHDYLKLDKIKHNHDNNLDNDNDNESVIGLCMIGTLFICTTMLLYF